MCRTIALTLTVLLSLTAQAADVSQDTYLILNLIDMHDEDAADLSEELGCEIEKDGTCRIPAINSKSEAPEFGIIVVEYEWDEAPISGSALSESLEEMVSLDSLSETFIIVNPDLGEAFHVADFEVDGDGGLLLWGADMDHDEALLYMKAGGKPKW